MPSRAWCSPGRFEPMTIVTHDPAVAAGLLEDGALVAFPTETVYGLGADASNDAAVARLFEAKGRPSFNPLIIHVASVAAAAEHGAFNATVEKLAEAFWPGPLTLVVARRAKSAISPLATAGLDSVGLRLPAHRWRRGCSRWSGDRSRRRAPIPSVGLAALRRHVVATLGAHRRGPGWRADGDRRRRSTIVSCLGDGPALHQAGRGAARGDRGGARSPLAGCQSRCRSADEPRPARQPLCAARFLG